MLIDVEAALPGGDPAAAAAELLGLLDRYGIDLALVHDDPAGPAEVEACNRRLFDATAGSDRLLACPSVDPREVTGEALRDLRRRGARAVRIHPRAHGYAYDPANLSALMRALQVARLPLFVDFSAVHWSQHAVDYGALAGLCRDWPDVPIVLVRRGLRDVRGLYDLWESGADVYAETSYYCVADGIRHAVERFGPGRLLFGSGLPVFEAACPIHMLGYAGITDDARGAIGAGNAAKLLGVPVAPGPMMRLAPHGMEIIDAHGHIGRDKDLYPTATDADAIAAVLRACGIGRAVLTSLPGLEGDPEGGHAELVAAVEKYPDLIAGYVDAEPVHDPDMLASVARRLDDAGMVGIKLHCEWSGVPFDDPVWLGIFRLADERRLPVLVHGVGPMDYVEKVCCEFPGMTLIAAHAGSFDAEGSLPWLQLASRVENLYVDTAGSVCFRGALDELWASCGLGKVLFATDFCYLDAAYELGRPFGSSVSADAMRMLLSGNMAAVLSRRVA